MEILRFEIPNAKTFSKTKEDGEIKPYITAYLRMTQKVPKKRPAMIVCPGGGYHYCEKNEAEPVAMEYLNAGMQAFILRYSTHTAQAPAPFPTALLELAYTVNLVREHAEEWNIDETKIFIIGFSAGGHLVGSYANFWSEDFVSDALQTTKENLRPTGVILAYPVISLGKYTHAHSREYILDQTDEKWTEENLSLENAVNPDTPPTFIWTTVTDDAVPVENTLLYINALQKQKICYEAHIFPEGRHGLSVANPEVQEPDRPGAETVRPWVSLSVKWVERF